MEGIIVFDMDGVLAEVTASYRAAIVETVGHFTRQADLERVRPAIQERGRLEQRLVALAKDRLRSGGRGRL